METVDPLGMDVFYFVPGVEDTVSTRAELIFEDFGYSRAWSGLVGGKPTQLRVSGGEALVYTSAGIPVVAKIGQVIYVLNVALSDVDFVVMVFHERLLRICVRVSAQTFKSSFENTARVSGVIVSTIARTHTAKPLKELESRFPNLKVEYQRVLQTFNVVGSVSATIPRIVVVVGAQGENLGAAPTLVGSKILGAQMFGVTATTSAVPGATPKAAPEVSLKQLLESTTPLIKASVPCPSPFVPFGALSGAACAGGSLASGGECDVSCYAGFVRSGEGKARCNGGTLAYSGCVPAPSHRTIEVAGAPELNGTYEAEVPHTIPLRWKSKSGAVIEASRTEPNKLELWMATDFKAAIVVSHSGGNTTLKVVGTPPGVTATFVKPCASPFVPFATVESGCQTSGGECAVKCHAGFAGGAKAKCTDGEIVFSGCVPVASHRTIELVGAGEYEGRYEAAEPYTAPVTWKGPKEGVAIEASTVEGDKLTLYDGEKAVMDLVVSSASGKTTLQVTNYPNAATATFGSSECADYWTKWSSCTASGDAACAAIAKCATATGAATSTLVDAGNSFELRHVHGAAGSLYGRKDSVIYVVKPDSTASTASTAKVIRKGTETELLDARLVEGKWVVDAKVDVVGTAQDAATTAVVPVPADCADLSACLKASPLATCATKATACKGKPTVAAGSKLEHGDKKVELYTLDSALFGSDDGGVFVVSVSKDDAKKGKRLFVAAGKDPSVVDVEYEEDKQTWREVKGTNWILIGSLIGGIVGALLLLALAWYLVSRNSQETVVSYAAPIPPIPPIPPTPPI
jgi:hypothetical protein